jgi:hypothetical protein
MSRKPEQTVIKVEIIDINRFDSRRTNRKRVEIPDRDAAERIPFNAKIRLQVFACGITEHNSSTDCEQNWPMKNDQERHEDEKAGDHATPKPPVTPRLCLIVLGHGTILLPVCHRAKRKSLRAFFPANRTYLPAARSGEIGGRQDCQLMFASESERSWSCFSEVSSLP